MHGSLVTSSLIRETTENESANAGYKFGQEEETYNIVAKFISSCCKSVRSCKQLFSSTQLCSDFNLIFFEKWPFGKLCANSRKFVRESFCCTFCSRIVVVSVGTVSEFLSGLLLLVVSVWSLFPYCKEYGKLGQACTHLSVDRSGGLDGNGG